MASCFRRLSFGCMLLSVAASVSAQDSISSHPVWVPLNATSPAEYKTVRALALRDGKLIAGGDFDSLGGVTGPGIVELDGGTWKSIGPVNRYGTVRALLVDHLGRLIAGGQFDSIGGVKAGNIAKWDGAAWSRMDTVSGSDPFELSSVDPIRTLTADANNVIYAAGDSRIAYDGICSYSIRILAWDGSGPSLYLREDLDQCPCSLTCMYKSTGIPLRGSGIDVILADRPGHLLYSGILDDISVTNQTNATAFNYDLSDVSAMALDGNANLYFAGTVGPPGGKQNYDAIRRITWKPSGGVVQDTSVPDLTPPMAFAMDKRGHLFFASGSRNPTVKVWDGKSILPLRGTVSGFVHALAVDDSLGRLYVGGEFDSAGGIRSPMVVGIDYRKTDPSASQPPPVPPERGARFWIAGDRLYSSLPSGSKVRIFSSSGRLLLSARAEWPLDIRALPRRPFLIRIEAGDRTLISRIMPHP